MVERLLSLPLEYWSQFMMVEQENIDPMHVIENLNAFSTPQTPDVKGKAEGALLKGPDSLSGFWLGALSFPLLEPFEIHIL